MNGKKVEYEHTTSDERKYWAFFYENLEKLSDIASIYNASSIAGKQQIVRQVFNNTLYLTKSAYETLEINPILTRKSLIINVL